MKRKPASVVHRWIMVLLIATVDLMSSLFACWPQQDRDCLLVGSEKLRMFLVFSESVRSNLVWMCCTSAYSLLQLDLLLSATEYWRNYFSNFKTVNCRFWDRFSTYLHRIIFLDTITRINAHQDYKSTEKDKERKKEREKDQEKKKKRVQYSYSFVNIFCFAELMWLIMWTCSLWNAVYYFLCSKEQNPSSILLCLCFSAFNSAKKLNVRLRSLHSSHLSDISHVWWTEDQNISCPLRRIDWYLVENITKIIFI